MVRVYGGRFCKWLETQGVTRPDEVTARYVRAYLAELAPKLADTTLHGHARAVKTLLIFWNEEGYLPQRVKFDMPKIADKKLLVLDAQELKKVISSCKKVRDKALVMILADTGVRRAELLALTWDDLDMSTGAVKVLRGKGGKYRVVFCGAKTRRILLKYRRESSNREGRIFLLTVTV
jgi:integrase/recombinase XerD